MNILQTRTIQLEAPLGAKVEVALTCNGAEAPSPSKVVDPNYAVVVTLFTTDGREEGRRLHRRDFHTLAAARDYWRSYEPLEHLGSIELNEANEPNEAIKLKELNGPTQLHRMGRMNTKPWR